MLWAYLQICLLIGLACSGLTYQTWLYHRAQAEPGRRVLDSLTGGVMLYGLYVLITEGLAWGLFIFLWPIGFLGDFCGVGRRASARRPVLLVHGYLNNRTAWMAHGLRFRLAGWTQVYTINLSPVSAPLDQYVDLVRQMVERICIETGTDMVDLVGHSMGGVVSRAYVQRFGGHEHVRHLVTLGSPHHGTTTAALSLWDNALAMAIGSDYLQELNDDPAGLHGVATTAIYTVHDNIVMPAESAALPEPAHTHVLAGLGHKGLLWSPRAWALLRSALETEETDPPATTAA